MNEKIEFDKLHNIYNKDIYVRMDNLTKAYRVPWYFSRYGDIQPLEALSIMLEWKIH